MIAPAATPVPDFIPVSGPADFIGPRQGMVFNWPGEMFDFIVPILISPGPHLLEILSFLDKSLANLVAEGRQISGEFFSLVVVHAEFSRGNEKDCPFDLKGRNGHARSVSVKMASAV